MARRGPVAGKRSGATPASSTPATAGTSFRRRRCSTATIGPSSTGVRSAHRHRGGHPTQPRRAATSARSLPRCPRHPRGAATLLPPSLDGWGVAVSHDLARAPHRRRLLPAPRMRLERQSRAGAVTAGVHDVLRAERGPGGPCPACDRHARGHEPGRRDRRRRRPTCLGRSSPPGAQRRGVAVLAARLRRGAGQGRRDRTSAGGADA